MLREIWLLRHFWLALAKQDLRDRYRRSFIGIAWSLIKPVATTLIIAGVFANVFGVAFLDYASFLFVGLVTWQFVTESILQGCGSFRHGATFLRVRPIPLAIFPLRVVLSAGIHALIGLAAAAITVGVCRGGADPFALVALIPAMAILAITAWSLACVAAILFVRYSDTQQIAEISLQALFYATPVIYLPESVPQTGWLRILIECNPFAAFLELVRRPIVHGEWPAATSMLVALAFMAVAATVAWIALRRVENRLVLWI